jgi:hypothetical protein
MFRLTKWYLDLVTDQGTALITYAASLAWQAIRVRYASTFLAKPGAAPAEHGGWTDVHLPEVAGDVLRFEHAGLAISGRWRRTSRPIEQTLLDDEVGRLHWACLFPAAAATATIRGESLAGHGYGECLTLTRPPWTLPLRRLRWGRTIASSHHAVWIEWSGGNAKQWVWLDGGVEAGADICDAAVTGLSDGRQITLRPFRELCDRRSLQVLSRRLPALDTLPLGPLRALREVKRLDWGTLTKDGLPIGEGWTIHEAVSW